MRPHPDGAGGAGGSIENLMQGAVGMVRDSSYVEVEVAGRWMEDSCIPESDFVSAHYDRDYSATTTNVLIIFSTPRSGSTLLCDTIYEARGPLAHEYFQPYQYMQILSQRWGALNGGKINISKYIQHLKKYRTAPNGWLGINVHAAHIPVFTAVKQELKDCQFHYVHIIRRDVIAQAVSYHIASITGQWTSGFKKEREAVYKFDGIREKMHRINTGNSNIIAYLHTQCVNFVTIYYEDLVEDRKRELARLQIPIDLEALSQPSLEKQRSHLNDEMIKRFSRDLIKEHDRASASGGRRWKVFGRAARSLQRRLT